LVGLAKSPLSRRPEIASRWSCPEVRAISARSCVVSRVERMRTGSATAMASRRASRGAFSAGAKRELISASAFASILVMRRSISTRLSGEPSRRTSSKSSNKEDSASGTDVKPALKAMRRRCQISSEVKIGSVPENASMKTKGCQNAHQHRVLWVYQRIGTILLITANKSNISCYFLCSEAIDRLVREGSKYS
jgi:hypothetical protein